MTSCDSIVTCLLQYQSLFIIPGDGEHTQWSTSCTNPQSGLRTCSRDRDNDRNGMSKISPQTNLDLLLSNQHLQSPHTPHHTPSHYNHKCHMISEYYTTIVHTWEISLDHSDQTALQNSTVIKKYYFPIIITRICNKLLRYFQILWWIPPIWMIKTYNMYARMLTFLSLHTSLHHFRLLLLQ